MYATLGTQSSGPAGHPVVVLLGLRLIYANGLALLWRETLRPGLVLTGYSRSGLASSLMGRYIPFASFTTLAVRLMNVACA